MRRRLMLWLTSVVTVSWLAAMVLAAVVMREEFDEAYDKRSAKRLTACCRSS